MNLQVYTGRQAGMVRETNQGERVVLQLVQGLENTGRNITTDNFFTSLSLANTLLEKKLSLLGTVRKNKGEIPSEFVGKINRK